MKKIISLLLVFLMLISIIACGDTSTDEKGGETTDTTAHNDTTENAGSEASAEITYDGIFQAGYARKDMTPDGNIHMNDGVLLNKVQDPLYVTCIAVYDGENTALLFTVDVKGLADFTCEMMKKRINFATKVPVENIMISATHSHSTPFPENPGSDPDNIRWTAKVNTQVIEAAKEAIADLSDAEIYTGEGKSTGMAFVRRWYLSDGTPSGIWRQDNDYKPRTDIVAYETKADDQVQVIRFVRKEKKDIVIANWQNHFTDANGLYPGAVSADIAAALRTNIEKKDDDALFAVYVGASGNLNSNGKVPGTKYYSYLRMGTALSDIILKACENATKVNAGKIDTTLRTLTVEIRKDDADVIAKAEAAKKEIGDAADSSDEAFIVCAKYGFESAHEVRAIISRNKSYGATEDVYVGAISFGDVAFVAAPYEMFDTNGMEIKSGSPFKMTFVLTNAGGAHAYVPAIGIVENGGYEVYTTKYVFGTGEMFVAQFIDMLNEHKNK